MIQKNRIIVFVLFFLSLTFKVFAGDISYGNVECHFIKNQSAPISIKQETEFEQALVRGENFKFNRTVPFFEYEYVCAAITISANQSPNKPRSLSDVRGMWGDVRGVQ